MVRSSGDGSCPECYGGSLFLYRRIKEAGDTYAQALELFDRLHGEDIHIRMLLVELVEYNLRIRNYAQAARFMTRLNRYPEEKLSVQEQAVRHIFNAYCPTTEWFSKDSPSTSG